MRHFSLTRVLVPSVVLILMAALPSPAAAPEGPHVVGIYLKLDGIPGSATDVKRPGEIEVISFNWSESNKEKGKPDPHDALILKAIDATTPKLAEALAAGKMIPTATVTIIAPTTGVANGKHEDAGPTFTAGPLVQYVFSDVQITAVSHTIIQRAEEQVQFKYGKLVIRYFGPDGKTVEAPATKSE